MVMLARHSKDFPAAAHLRLDLQLLHCIVCLSCVVCVLCVAGRKHMQQQEVSAVIICQKSDDQSSVQTRRFHFLVFSQGYITPFYFCIESNCGSATTTNKKSAISLYYMSQ